tara:strand:- start:160875 stop:161036 length:162 start_codon:yes stop_codon:yes gene_type:complete
MDKAPRIGVGRNAPVLEGCPPIRVVSIPELIPTQIAWSGPAFAVRGVCACSEI